MEKSRPGSEEMPDFDKLTDRIIAEPTNSPKLVIKTNLDQKGVLEGNPYFQNGDEKKKKKFEQFFNED